MKIPKQFPVTCHTDYVGPNTTFVVIKGQNQDGTRYIPLALEKGATTLVVEHDVIIPETIDCSSIIIKRVDNARKALAHLAAQAAGFPSKKLKIVGITGTKGKSTTTHIMHHLLQAAGYKVACLSTVYNMIDGVEFDAPLTTAQPDYLHQFLKLCVDRGIEYVVMEVAAQAFTFNRVETIEFDAAIFTNLDKEHGELYATEQEYFATKCQLFQQVKQGAPILVNCDDKHGKMLFMMHDNFTGFAVYDIEADVQVKFSTQGHNEYSCEFELDDKEYRFLYSTFPGLFNGYNIISAVVTLMNLGISLDELRSGLRSIPPLRGRLEEYLLPNGARGIIDYAHTPASFEALFSTARSWTDDLIVVFGAGGGRDHEKRSLMGAIAAQWADKVIVSSDNPRHEKVEEIMGDITSSISDENKLKIVKEPDRKKAIELAYSQSKRGSVIFLLGKGPDEYQIVGDSKSPFSEKNILLSL